MTTNLKDEIFNTEQFKELLDQVDKTEREVVLSNLSSLIEKFQTEVLKPLEEVKSKNLPIK